MKNYIKLTVSEALRQFAEKEPAKPQTPQEVSDMSILDRFRGDVCITITMPTHRIGPDYSRDPLELKNLIDQAEKTLYEYIEKRKVWPISENLREAQNSIDHSHNLDSLVLYANEHFSSVIKLPVELPSEVMIGLDFDLRPLYKSRQQNQRYFIITVSKQKIRLIEAFNDKVVDEIETQDFPFERTPQYTVNNRKKKAADIFVDNMEKEFYNDADKSFRKYYLENPLPVILAGDTKSVSYYEQMMDDTCPVIARVAGSFDNTKLHEIVEAVNPALLEYRENKHREYLEAIDKGASAGLLTTGLEEIMQTALDANAAALFLENSMSVEGIVNRDGIKIFDENNQEIMTHDILHLLIWNVNKSGGEIVFMEDGSLAEYDGIVLIRRY